ncbi:MAG: hypothetical protein IPK26_20370 [Planctomycetes bacterium]|nr:hypothetical protein [Planctomycetota bacterium]
MDAALLAAWVASTCWRLPQGEREFAANMLTPALEQLSAHGSYVPPRLLAELLLLDAPYAAVRRSSGDHGLPRAFVEWLADLHQRVRQVSGITGTPPGVGARLVRGVDRALRVHGMSLPEAEAEPGTLLRRHVAHWRLPTRSALRSDEAKVESLLDRVLAAPGSLGRFLGPAFTNLLPRQCAPDHVDPVLAALLQRETEGETSAVEWTARQTGGSLPRDVRAPFGVFSEWAPGPLPASLRIHPLNWTYRAVSPEYFVHLAAQGQLRQPFGVRRDPGKRCARVLVDLDLSESLAMHRFQPQGKGPPLISATRAVLCLTMHRLAERCVADGCELAFRLRRCGPGSDRPGPMHLVPVPVAAAFARSPAEVLQWLATWLPEFVVTRPLAPLAPASAERPGPLSHHARVLLGEVPARRLRVGDPMTLLPSRTSVGLRLQMRSVAGFRYGIGHAGSLATAAFTGEAAFDSPGQVATFVVGMCLAGQGVYPVLPPVVEEGSA